MTLKSIVAIMFTLPTIAFASSSCYEATTATPVGIPNRLCVESIQESVVDGKLDVVSADNSVPAALKITSTTRHTEDRVRFVAEAVIANEWQSGCGDGFKATLIAKGEVTTGTIYTHYLDLAVETLSTNDTCHSRPQLNTIKYELVK